MSPADDGTRSLNVFVTGGTGYIGRSVVRQLVDAGHKVSGLTHRREGLDELRALGATAVPGDVRSPDGWRTEASQADVLIHLAEVAGADRAAADRAAVETMLWAVHREESPRGSVPRVVIYTSGCFVLGPAGAEPADESAPLQPPELVAFRPANEQLVLRSSSDDVATAVIRPGMVFGGGQGLIGDFFATAVDEGAARYVGDGANRWSPIYREDVARLYRLVSELRAGGIFHAVDGTATPVSVLARSASTAAGRAGRTHAVPLAEARRSMGALADALVMDQALVSARTRELGWQPEQAPFTESAASLFHEWEESRH